MARKRKNFPQPCPLMRRGTDNRACLACVGLAVMFMAIMASCRPPATDADGQLRSDMITIRGSDTMVHLVTMWVEAYAQLRPNQDISVTGGGSGTGIVALLEGNADICAASREMTEHEFEQARLRGLDIREYEVALDAIVIAVNPANLIDELTMRQVRDIYTGAVTDWSEVGGAAGEIVLLSRESSSGTFVFFQEHVLEKQDFAPGALLMPATSSIIRAVSEDEQVVGYVGLGYARAVGERVKVLSIRADDAAPAVAPTEATVRSGAYAISRPLFYYVSSPVRGSVSGFIDFCLSGQGQEIVQQTGYVAVNR